MDTTKTEVRVRGEHFEQIVAGTDASSADIRGEWENTLITEAEARGLQAEINYYHPRATNTPIAYPASTAADEAIEAAESAALALAEKSADSAKAEGDLEKHSDITVKIRRATHAIIESGLLGEQQRTKNPKLTQAAYLDSVVNVGVKTLSLNTWVAIFEPVKGQVRHHLCHAPQPHDDALGWLKRVLKRPDVILRGKTGARYNVDCGPGRPSELLGHLTIYRIAQ